MSIFQQNSKTMLLWDESYALASGQDFTGNVGMAAAFASGVTTGEATLTAPAVGGRIAGILKNNDASAVAGYERRGVVCKLGMTMGRALGTFNAGIELMVGDVYGRLTTATAGNYVVAISREASTVVDGQVAVELVHNYKI